MLTASGKRLRQYPLARVQLPVLEVDDVIVGFMDGVLITTECTDERVTQNAYYCGYDNDTIVNNVMACGPVGNFLCTQLSRELEADC